MLSSPPIFSVWFGRIQKVVADCNVVVVVVAVVMLSSCFTQVKYTGSYVRYFIFCYICRFLFVTRAIHDFMAASAGANDFRVYMRLVSVLCVDVVWGASGRTTYLP